MAGISTDQLTGIERYKPSLDYGKLVCPTITIWNTPGQTSKPDAVAGKLRHEDEVTVLKRVRVNGRVWYRVRSSDKEVVGWVRASFLLDHGKTDAEGS